MTPDELTPDDLTPGEGGAEPREAHDELFDALVFVDLPVLDALLDTRFVIEHPTGLVQSKLDWMDDIAEGLKEYHAIDHVESAVSGTAAHPVLVSRTLTEATIGSLHATWRLQLTSRLVPVGDEWVITRTTVSTW
ncbi:hypothetical protein EDF54_3338 [Rathayibacter sp. PhB93]|uniref:nuclear transport factor 2 family protein n=1 Tax=unclassified Rathayibacter TaxID=2609250 RepID=UPI000F47DAB3|nr:MULTISPECIES: nuclear transport factor 2 family protein [unclassified Rathayibacter]ROQ03857.1 hypothetical protein EDF54_3338 [Rathayibacter sp. PhB93]TDQ10883.1 hypothetical protein EDF17_3126 [Rathayibacter sp. PhB1]